LGRPKGSRNNPGAGKPGPKPALFKAKSVYSPGQIAEWKAQVVTMFDEGVIETLTEGARILALRPSVLYGWMTFDHEWTAQIRQAKEAIADRIEKNLLDSTNPNAQMFLLKGYRPQFRDNFKLNVTSEALEKLLEELKSLAGRPEPAQIVESTAKELPPGISSLPFSLNEQEKEGVCV